MSAPCEHRDVANMDHAIGYYGDTSQMTNRYCRSCGTHWYGDAGVAVFEIPQRVWDRWMDSGKSCDQAKSGPLPGRAA